MKIFDSQQSNDAEIPDPVSQKSMSSLAIRLQSSASETINKSRLSLEDELTNFKYHSVLGDHLRELINALSLIQPSSVDNERAFSTCTLINTAQRQRLKPEKINTILFVNKFITTFC